MINIDQDITQEYKCEDPPYHLCVIKFLKFLFHEYLFEFQRLLIEEFNVIRNSKKLLVGIYFCVVILNFLCHMFNSNNCLNLKFKNKIKYYSGPDEIFKL